MTMTKTGTDEQTVDYITLGPVGTGSIQAGTLQQERLEEFTRRVGSGEFHRPTDVTIPVKCIDGRCGGHGALMPNAAGGTESLMVADDLTTKLFAVADDAETVSQHKNVLTSLAQQGLPVGGHTAAELHGAPSGCGANDKLADIYAYITQYSDTLRSLATDVLGYDINDADHDLIVGNASKRQSFTSGDQLLEALETIGGTESIDVLRGAHTEVMAVINRRSGTTLDREAVESEFGDNYESFNVDEWAFRDGAKAISLTDNQQEEHQKHIAMLYYNLATAGVLCGPDMRVVVLN